VLLYYITDRKQFPGPEPRRRELLLAKISEAARAGVDYIQLREKDLPARELELLARQAVRLCRETRNQKRETRLLINARSDLALATGADGVHLPSNDITASEARAICSSVLARNVKLEALCGREAERSEAGSPQPKSRAKRGSPETSRTCIIAVSCHTPDEVHLAETEGADFAVFGPVFEKVGTSLRVGLAGLRAACQVGRLPVLAIGGITLHKAAACIEVGATGVAAIRLFQENDVREIVGKLRRAG